MGIRIGVAVAAMAAVAWTANARAASISYTGSFSDDYSMPGSGGAAVSGTAPIAASVLLFGPAQSVTLPKFDPGLGTLTGALIQMHEAASDVQIYLDLTGFAGTSSPTAQVSGSSGSSVSTLYNVPLITGWQGSVTGPSDSVSGSATGPDYGSGFTSTLSYLQDGIEFLVTHVATAPDLPSFVGAASFFDVFFQLGLHYEVDCNSTSSPACQVETYLVDRSAWSGDATVTYTYDPAAVRIAEPAALPVLALGLLGFAALRRWSAG